MTDLSKPQDDKVCEYVCLPAQHYPTVQAPLGTVWDV